MTTVSPALTPALSPDADAPDTRFVLFTWLWAYGVGVGLLMFPSWATTVLGWCQALSLLAVLVRPGRVAVFGVFILFSTLRGVEKTPLMANHIFLELLMSATMLTALIAQSVRRRRLPTGGEWLDGFGGPLRVQLALLYAFAVFHKLNVDYFDVQRSCGSRLLVMLTDALRLPEPNWYFRWMSIVGTLVIELAIAGGLFLKSTRKAALALGIGFHFVLGLLPHEGLPSFSSMLFALFFLFWGDDMLPPARIWLAERREQFAWAWRGRSGRRSVLKVLATIALIGVVTVGLAAAVTAATTVRADEKARLVAGVDFGKMAAFLDRLALSAFLLIAVPYVWAFLRTTRVTGWRGPAAVRGLIGRPAVSWVFVPVMLLAGFGPYLGLRTGLSFSMFSNLTTEFNSNHFLVPRSWQVFDYQRDMLQHVSGLSTELQKAPVWHVNAYNFRRYMEEAKPGTKVVYVRNGETRTIVKGQPNPADPDLTVPLSWWEGKYFMFRAINLADTGMCRH